MKSGNIRDLPKPDLKRSSKKITSYFDQTLNNSFHNCTTKNNLTLYDIRVTLLNDIVT